MALMFKETKLEEEKQDIWQYRLYRRLWSRGRLVTLGPVLAQVPVRVKLVVSSGGHGAWPAPRYEPSFHLLRYNVIGLGRELC